MKTVQEDYNECYESYKNYVVIYYIELYNYVFIELYSYMLLVILGILKELYIINIARIKRLQFKISLEVILKMFLEARTCLY